MQKKNLLIITLVLLIGLSVLFTTSNAAQALNWDQIYSKPTSVQYLGATYTPSALFPENGAIGTFDTLGWNFLTNLGSLSVPSFSPPLSSNVNWNSFHPINNLQQGIPFTDNWTSTRNWKTPYYQLPEQWSETTQHVDSPVIPDDWIWTSISDAHSPDGTRFIHVDYWGCEKCSPYYQQKQEYIQSLLH